MRPPRPHRRARPRCSTRRRPRRTPASTSRRSSPCRRRGRRLPPARGRRSRSPPPARRPSSRAARSSPPRVTRRGHLPLRPRRPSPSTTRPSRSRRSSRRCRRPLRSRIRLGLELRCLRRPRPRRERRAGWIGKGRIDSTGASRRDWHITVAARSRECRPRSFGSKPRAQPAIAGFGSAARSLW